MGREEEGRNGGSGEGRRMRENERMRSGNGLERDGVGGGWTNRIKLEREARGMHCR